MDFLQRKHIPVPSPYCRVVRSWLVDTDLSDSGRQYKRKISEWGLDKKVKSHEMNAIIRKKHQRKIEFGKRADSGFEANWFPM